MKIDIKTLDNGTRTLKNINGETMHECQYCGTWFQPKRRFVQKYCSESCRVMACRKRKVGLYGTVGGNINDRSNVTNLTILNKLDELKQIEARVNELSESINDRADEDYKETSLINTKLDKIKRNSEYQLLVSIILPFVADPIKNKLQSIFSSKDKPIEDVKGFEDILEPFKDEMPKETHENIIKVVKSFYKAKQDMNEAKNKSNTQDKGNAWTYSDITGSKRYDGHKENG